MMEKSVNQIVNKLPNDNEEYIVVSARWDSYWVDKLTKKQIEDLLKKGYRYPTHIIKGTFVYSE